MLIILWYVLKIIISVNTPDYALFLLQNSIQGAILSLWDS